MKDVQGDSFTFTLKTTEGYEGLYTLRERDNEDNKTFFDRVEETSKLLTLSGFEVVEKFWSMPKTTTVQNLPTATTGGHLGNCEKCGAPKLLSKMGKQYCSKLCWKEQTY